MTIPKPGDEYEAKLRIVIQPGERVPAADLWTLTSAAMFRAFPDQGAPSDISAATQDRMPNCIRRRLPASTMFVALNGAVWRVVTHCFRGRPRMVRWLRMAADTVAEPLWTVDDDGEVLTIGRGSEDG